VGPRKYIVADSTDEVNVRPALPRQPARLIGSGTASENASSRGGIAPWMQRFVELYHDIGHDITQYHHRHAAVYHNFLTSLRVFALIKLAGGSVGDLDKVHDTTIELLKIEGRHLMIEIRPLLQPDDALITSLIRGYTSSLAYRVSRSEGPDYSCLQLDLVRLEQPTTKRYPSPDAATLRFYRDAASQGYSFGAYDHERCAGLALTGLQAWNASLILHEFHIDPDYQRQGIGQRLMRELIAHATVSRRVRCIAAETQSSNVPAIQFYRRMGFVLDGIDLSYYTNEDVARGEVAVFMKKHLPDGDAGVLPAATAREPEEWRA
jgi:ribosomal protein S18 acetylase RimI-like enzyme